MPRLRKAFVVTVDGHDDAGTVYAPTASKAKGQVLHALLDVGYDAKDAFARMCARRAPASDVLLPDEHRLVAELTPEERHIIAHAYGSGAPMGREGYRDHYCTAPSSPSGRLLLRLSWELGLFSGPYGGDGYAESSPRRDAFFHLTELGCAVARSMLPTYARR